jgi:hypothetical protein
VTETLQDGVFAARPFGYSVEIRSALSPEEAKAALRTKMTGWFDMKSGPRGWIVGPWLCIWLDAFDQAGPMMLARITGDGAGSHIRGRAASNFKGVMIAGILAPAAIAIPAIYLSTGGAQYAWMLLPAFACLAISLLILWSGHLFRAEAGPLIRVVRNIVEPQPGKKVAKPRARDRTPIQTATLIVDGEETGKPPSADAIAQAISEMEPGGFLIVAFAPEAYMQAALEYDRFSLEKREGGRDRHFRAAGEFEAEEIAEAMTAYLLGRKSADRFVWESIRL